MCFWCWLEREEVKDILPLLRCFTRLAPCRSNPAFSNAVEYVLYRQGGEDDAEDAGDDVAAGLADETDDALGGE